MVCLEDGSPSSAEATPTIIIIKDNAGVLEKILSFEMEFAKILQAVS